MPRIAVDLTPILPGGENGGAKIMTIELLRQLSHLAPDCKFILLTQAKSHQELAVLDAMNVRRFCINPSELNVINNKPVQVKLPKTLLLKQWLMQRIPVPLKIRLSYIYQRLRRKKMIPQGLLKNLSIDLLFSPFTAPLHYEKDIPFVSVIYDLQSYYYPNFFTQKDCYYRRKYFQEACQLATRLICISDYVKGTIYKNCDNNLTSEQVITIYIALYYRLPKSTAAAITLERLALKSDSFLLYPANFWPHKNHKMLLTAYSIYRAKEPNAKLKLVCTGFPSPDMNHLQTAAKEMGLADLVIFPGYVADEEFAVLMEACRAVVFPSLYEGFGMPILEAMAMNKPVLCSDVTSLPEIAGDAALLFDPRKPEQIAAAITQIEKEDHLVTELIARGKQRVQKFGDSKTMALQYLQVFRDVLNQRSNSRS